MARMIDQIRASRLPSNMMQFAARGALQVPPAENIEILVHLAVHNKVFGDLARMTLAGWDEKASRTAAADPQSSQEVLSYFIHPDNLRPRLLPELLENPSVREEQIARLATSALRDTIELLLNSERVRRLHRVLDALKSNPYLKKEELPQLENWMRDASSRLAPEAAAPHVDVAQTTSAGNISRVPAHAETQAEIPHESESNENSEATFGVNDETVFAYLQEHAADIAAEGEKPFQAIGGIIDQYFPDEEAAEVAAPPKIDAASATAGSKPTMVAPKPAQDPSKRLNTVQKINGLDVKGRIQLALKGNKEERSILIRDGTKVVALAVLEAPKISDGEVEKFASQKNVLEAVLRQIPLKRRFMKNYIVVRNLVANPRTPLDLSLGLMKNLLTQDLKNLSSNKEVSDTIRKLAMKMYKQKLDAANKK